MENYTLFDDFHSSQQNFYPECRTDCFMTPELPEFDLLDAMLHESYFGMEHVNDKYMDLLTTSDPRIRSAFEDEFINISDLNFTPASYYDNRYHVKYPDINYLDISKENSNLLGENFQGFREKNKEFNTNLPNLLFPVSHSQEYLQSKKITLVPLATSLDKENISENLKRGLGVEEDKIIPFPNNDMTNNTESQYRLGKVSVLEAKGNKLQTGKRGLKRVHEGEKGERYWKQRMKNNAAAKKSRVAKKNRFVLMEKRIKELEVENAEKKEYLRTLEQKVLERRREIKVSDNSE